MKRSASNEQTLDMNRTDFARNTTTRKTNYGFNIEFKKGRVSNTSTIPALAKQLTEVLMEDDVTRTLLRQGDYEVSMNNKFQLNIKNAASASPPTDEPSADGVIGSENGNGAETE